MAEKSSFFASVGGDRKYGAADWAAYFGALVGNGYFAASLTALQATASGSGLGVSVNAGKAFINGYFYNNTEPLALTLDPADGVLPRIDRIVVRLSYTGRAINTVIKKGTPASSPTAPAMQRDAEAWELALADVTIPAGATAISAQNIADRRNDKAYCGPVVAMIEHIDTDEFAQQIESALGGVQEDANALLEQIRAELDGVRDESLYLLKSGGTMTGAIAFSEEAAKQTRQNLGVPETADAVSEDEENPVSGAAVYNYAMSKDTLVLTVEDPGAGVSVAYPDGTVILVYE